MTKKIGLWFCIIALAGFTAGCGFLTPSPAKNKNSSQPSIAQPPSLEARPDSPVTTANPALSDLQPLGLNAPNPFETPVKNTDDRLSRVENVVLELKREFEQLKPSILRLVDVESDLQDLIGQLDALLTSEVPPPSSAAQPPAQTQALAKPQPLIENLSENDTEEPALDDNPEESPAEIQAQKPENPKPAASAPAASGATAVRSFRIGEHRDKVRLVMDVSAKTDYVADLDNQENLLIIELPKASWSASNAQSFAKSPLLKSYSVEPIGNGGSRVILTLRKSTEILKQQALPPSAENPNYRVFLDLKS